MKINFSISSQTSLDTASIYYSLFIDFEVFGKTLNSIGISQKLYDNDTKIFFNIDFNLVTSLSITIIYNLETKKQEYLAQLVYYLYLAVSILKDPTHTIPSFIVFCNITLYKFTIRRFNNL